MSPELNKEFVQFIIHYIVNYLSLFRKDIKFSHLRKAYEHPPPIEGFKIRHYRQTAVFFKHIFKKCP